ncbi:hypothetical protein EDD22DRAFT_978919 [Suillus occidentalis]|nr:hypothetical protein EDD22DRAFT_978919 [Suillus occidentalis]
MHYCAIITSPEQLVKAGEEFEKLLQKPTFTSQMIGFVFDKAYCITSWGEFCSEYKELEHLQYILPCYVPFMIASAMLIPNTLQDVQRYSLSSYMDIAFLIPTGWMTGDQVPPKFLIFFDSI